MHAVGSILVNHACTCMYLRDILVSRIIYLYDVLPLLCHAVAAQADTGFRIDEKIGHRSVSVVVEVADRGAAQLRGVRPGFVVVGINGERYISHAHCVATLKHAKRPLVVRFAVPSGR
jgi:hypothetical protein